MATYYFLDTATAVASLFSLYTALASLVPPDVHAQVESSGDVIEDTTGALTGSWLADPVASVVGTGNPVYAAPVGLLLRWATNAVIDGKRLRGRTFVVPASGTDFDTDGTVLDTTVTGVNIPLAAFVASQAASFVIWHRPFAGAPAAPPRPARPAHPGAHALVESGTLADKAVVLRSRRD